MKECNSCFVNKSLSEYRPYRSRGVAYYRNDCRDCERAKGRVHDKKRTESGDTRRRLLKAYYKDKQKTIKRNREYRRKNKDKVNAYAREYFKIYYPKNRERILLRTKLLDASRRTKVPVWLTKEHKRCIRDWYKLAKKIEQSTGIKQNVDHIIPLNHKDVCGLHVPWNLQILTQSENCTKNNRFDGTYDNLGWKREN